MSTSIDEFKGFEELEDMLSDIAKEISQDNLLDVLEDGAKEFADIVRRLPKPRSQINKPGYTHMLDLILTERTSKEVLVGWGKYYGRFVEEGTSKMGAQPHLRPTWDRNKETIYKHMLKKLKL